MKIFECVPNVSEGRDAATLAACARAIEDAGVTLAHRTHDAIHHRSVFTYFGAGEPVLDAALALARVAAERIDLRVHRGAHPRIGALDVLPFVPFGDATESEAVALAREAATRIWHELRVPSFFYGAASEATRVLADVRRGEFEGLQARADFDTGETPHVRGGAIAIGVRGPLVAFNVVLANGDLALAKSIARALRERDGGLCTLRALGIALADGRVQVSCNITDPNATPLRLVVALVRELARRAGAVIARTELIGLVPRAALEDVVVHALGSQTLPRLEARRSP
ncbi:MAG: glutamate formiminotransferase [Candidatus Eremiobacteraeota bacterium]|nr:glutamate formiminotransferase [Candidatus Eremiobacteraeota bacterium]